MESEKITIMKTHEMYSFEEVSRNKSLILKIVNEDRTSKFKKNMHESRKYWLGDETPIHKRNVQSIKVAGSEIKDPTAANNKLLLRDFKKIVKQAANYSFAKPITLKGFKEAAMKNIDEMLRSNKWQNKLLGFSIDSQRFAVGYLYPYVDKDKFRFKRFDPSDIITFYSDGEGDVLDGFIRYYQTWDYTTIKTKQKKQQEDKVKVRITRVELYSNSLKSTYGIVDGEIQPYDERYFPEAGKLHTEPLLFQETTDGETKESKEKVLKSWTHVPLISMWFDFESGMTQLHELKEYIDAGSINLSDWANDVEDIQEAIWVLKGYDSKSLLQFIKDMKEKKAISLGDNEKAEATPHQNTIPTEARDKLITHVREAIYSYGRAVDTRQIPKSGDLRNIQIEAMFADQDEKATEFEAQMTAALNALLTFFQDFRTIKGEKALETDGMTSFVYKRTKIQNQTELLSSNAGQIGVVSEETRLSNHPWVTNPTAEIEKLAAEGEPMVVATNVDGALTPEQQEALAGNSKQLNGAQMQSLISIVQAFAEEDMTQEAAITSLSLIGVDRPTAAKIVVKTNKKPIEPTE